MDFRHTGSMKRLWIRIGVGVAVVLGVFSAGYLWRSYQVRTMYTSVGWEAEGFLEFSLNGEPHFHSRWEALGSTGQSCVHLWRSQSRLLAGYQNEAAAEVATFALDAEPCILALDTNVWFSYWKDWLDLDELKLGEG